MAAKKLILIIHLIIIPIMAYSYKNDSLLIVSGYPERFDEQMFEKIKKTEHTAYTTFEDGTVIEMEKWDNESILTLTPLNSYFYLKKIFYPNGNIAAKGLGFVYEGFKKGIWYYFDENGKVTEKDHDLPFTFTFEQMIQLAKKYGVVFEKTSNNKNIAYSTQKLKRGRESGTTECWWELWKETDSVYTDERERTFRDIEIFRFDGKTGKEVSRKYEKRRIGTTTIDN